MKTMAMAALLVALLSVLSARAFGQGWGPSSPLPRQAAYEPAKRTVHDLYMVMLSMPRPDTLFSSICPEGRDSVYHLVDVSNGTPADAVIDCGAFHAGKGQLVKVVPYGRTSKVSFFVELVPVGELWQVSVYSNENRKVQKRFTWDLNGLQGSFEDYRPDASYAGAYKDGVLVGKTVFTSKYGDLDWDNDGKGNITYVRMYYPDGSVALKGPCSEGGYCATQTKSGNEEAAVMFKSGCVGGVAHRCYFTDMAGMAEGD